MPRSRPAEGTKRCPYCAEVIQAAAIKCRYCQSDLTEAPESASSPVAPAAPAAPPADPAASPAPGDPRPRSRRRWSRADRVVLAVAGVVTLSLLGATAWVWQQGSGIEDEQQAARSARAAVTEKVEMLLSYDHETFDEDAAAAEKVLTPRFGKEYAPTRQTIRDRAVEQRRSQQAKVAAVSVISQDEDEVETLLFVDTVSTREGSRRQRVLQNRVKVTLVREDDAWLIDDLTVPQS